MVPIYIQRVSMIVKITNMTRIKDYRSILGNSVSLVLGYDDKPLLDDADACITTKAIKGGKGFLIEDTTIIIEDDVYNTITDLDEDHHDKPALWTTRIAYHSGYMIHYYEGNLPGRIRCCSESKAETCHFGDIFIPESYDLSINEIEKDDNLIFTNARQLALKKMLMGESYHVEIIDIASQRTLSRPHQAECLQEH